MKLFVNASIFSVVFAGFVANALTSHSAVTPAHQGRSMVVSSFMPVPSCSPKTGCVADIQAMTAALRSMPVPSCSPKTGCVVSEVMVAAMPVPSCSPKTGCAN
jgi:hypothetical protein